MSYKNPYLDVEVPDDVSAAVSTMNSGSIVNDHKLNPAIWAYERLVKSIIAFEEKLDKESEIGARLINFGNENIYIDDMGYWGPDFVIYYGKRVDGSPVELIQHLSQTNVLLVALQKQHDEPRRIGFVLGEKLNVSDERKT